MTPDELRERTMRFALAAFRFARPLMKDGVSRHVALQGFRAATAVAANYRSACLGRSTAEFIAKMGVVREEADESAFWLEFLTKSGLSTTPECASLLAEARELSNIFGAAYRTTKARHASKSQITNHK
jgi:four helix bundle protein